jgi:hypothetical protein
MHFIFGGRFEVSQTGLEDGLRSILAHFFIIRKCASNEAAKIFKVVLKFQNQNVNM